MSVFAAKDVAELEDIFKYCLSLGVPCSIRYPSGRGDEDEIHVPIAKSLWEYGETVEDNVILCVGMRAIKIARKAAEISGKSVSVVNCRSVKPLDNEYLSKLAGKNVITVEENVTSGGFGSAIAEYFAKNNVQCDLKIFAFPDKFVRHSSVDRQIETAGITAENVAKALK